MATDEELMKQGEALAARSGLETNHLAMVLAHLIRRRDPKSTLRLLQSLPKSPFAHRTGSTKEQLDALLLNVRPILTMASSWQDAATIVGWAKRLRAANQK